MYLGPGLPGLPCPSSSFQVPYPAFLGTEDFVALFPLPTYVYTEVQEEEWASSATWRLLSALLLIPCKPTTPPL